MKSLPKLPTAFCIASLALAWAASAQVNITTWQADTQHTGNNASETILTPGNVSSPGNFGLLFSHPLDGETYGQTLLASGVNVGGTTHNVVYAATQHCSIYAFDADNATGGNANPLWQVALLPAGCVPFPQSVSGSSDIPLEVGLTTTPVIDRAGGTIYVVSKVQRTADTTYHQYLYALDLATGAAKFNSPVEITASFNGNATVDSVAGKIPFNPLREHLRCAMTLYNGVVYLTYASHSDTTPYHGEILGYDATTLQLVKTFIDTPNGGGNPEAGIWMSGASPAIDKDGNMFLSTGNGTWDGPNSNWGQSILKLPTTGTFNVAYSNPLNWFTPYYWSSINNGDLDLGSGGLLLLPDQAGPHPHLLVCGGKGAVLYVIDRDNLGGMHNPDNSIQEIPSTNGKWFFVTPAYFHGYLYYSNSGGPLEQRAVAYNAVDGSYVSNSPVTSADTFNNMGSGCFITSNGTANGIVWILNGNGVSAYNAANVSGNPIYTTRTTLAGNVTIQNTKFSLPMAANGKVYFTGYNVTKDTNNKDVYNGYLVAYGLLPTAVGTPDAPSDAAAVANTSSSIAVTWASHSTNESGFKVKRSTSPTSGFGVIATTSAGATSCLDTGRNPATTYYYQIVATNANGDSNASNVAQATTFPNYFENGLVAFWNMDDLTSSRIVSDITGNGHTGSIGVEANVVPGGFVNNAVNFHGTGQTDTKIVVTDKADLRFTAGQSFTLSAWVYPGALRSSEEAIIAKSRDAGNYYGVWINAGNQWIFRGPAGDITGPAVTQGVWTHVAVVQDAGGATPKRTLYINGAAVATGAVQAADGTGALWMGQQNITGNAASFPGNLDEVRLYGRALAAGEIANLMGPPVLEAHSSQTAGTAGMFGVPIWPAASKKIEPRKGSVAGQYNLVLTFSAPVSGFSATLRRPADGAPVGSVSAINFDSSRPVAVITLNGVGNAQNLNLHLTGISPGNATADIPFNVLWGDVNGDNIVNNLDLSILQNTHAPVVSAANATDDLNGDGAVTAADDVLVSAAAGTSLGAQFDTNLAIFQPCQSSSDNNNNTDVAAHAFDNDLTTRWDSAHGVDPQSIYVNLGAPCVIHKVVLDWENAAGKNYTLDVTNDVTAANSWQTIQPVTGNTTTGFLTYPGATTNFSGVSAQFVRMNGTARTGPYGYSLYDFEVIGLSGTGGVPLPTVNSAAAVTVPVGGAFSYQIAATNNPTGFGAASLPTGLNISSGGLITGTLSQTGTFTPTIKATNATGTGSATLTINVLAPFAAWQTLYFTSAELADPKISGLGATPAGDGITNLLKYALNLHPKVSGVSSLPTRSLVSAGGQRYLALTFTKVLAATDLTYTVEVSSDLRTWNSGSGYTAAPTVVNNPDGKTQTVTVRDLTPVTGGNRRFIRLNVSTSAGSGARQPARRL